jgi:glycosyltransferase involved in cell wall biosynthesis
MAPSMRIAEVAPPWLAVPPTGYGGIEWVVALLADGLVDRGHDVTLFATGDSRTRARLEYLFDEAPGPKHINDPWYDTVHTLHAFRDPTAFDVAHVHAPYSALAAGVAAGGPVVHTLHGPFTDEMRTLYSLVADRVWFVAISEAQRSHMPELRYAGVVYNGIDVASYPFVDEKDDFVLFLGRLAPEKGALRAVLAAREAGTRLVLAGKVADPAEERHWQEEVLPALPPDATILGEISIEEKMDLLSRARAVLFPIDWDEPFGLVMTEAMACGTPVIATPRGSVPEVVADGETGFVVSVDDYPAEAAAALARIDQIDPAACRARVEERFGTDSMVAGYEQAFAMAVASTGYAEGAVRAGKAVPAVAETR